MISQQPAAFQSGLPDALEAAVINLMDGIGMSRNNILTAGIPVVQANSGTVATNGTVTLATALTGIFAKCWMWLPAAAIVGGAAGLYYVKMSSTTVGQVYTPYVAPATSGFIPYDPEVASVWNSTAQTLVAAVGSNAGYVNVISVDNVLMQFTIPASFIGVNGKIKIQTLGSGNNSAGAKIVKHKVGATTVASASSTTDIVGTQESQMQNRGILNSQVYSAKNFVAAAVASTVGVAANDFATAIAVAITGQVAVAADSVIIDFAQIEIIANG